MFLEKLINFLKGLCSLKITERKISLQNSIFFFISTLNNAECHLSNYMEHTLRNTRTFKSIKLLNEKEMNFFFVNLIKIFLEFAKDITFFNYNLKSNFLSNSSS